MNPNTQTSPGIGPLGAQFSALGGVIIDVVGTNGQRLTAQIPAASMFKGWPGLAWQPVGSTTFDGATIEAALGGGIAKANLRVTLVDGDCGSPNPVYVAMFGSGYFPYYRGTPQPPDWDFDAGQNLYFGFADTTGPPCSAVIWASASPIAWTPRGTRTTFSRDFPGTYALWDIVYTVIPHPAHYMAPVQAGVAPGVWPVTGWFAVPDASLAALYDVMLTGTITVGVHDVGAGDQYFDFTQGLAVDVIDIPIQPPVIPPEEPPDVFGSLLLDLWVWRELHRFSALTQDLNFPPGYGKALLYALMVEMFSEYPAAAKKYDFDELLAETEDAVKDLEVLNVSDAVAAEPPV